MNVLDFALFGAPLMLFAFGVAFAFVTARVSDYEQRKLDDKRH